LEAKKMKLFSRGLCALLLGAFLCVSVVQADTQTAAPDEPVLTAMLHAFLAGASRNDAQAHDRFWSEKLVYTSSGGERFGKADIMDGMSQANDEVTTVYSAEDIRTQQFGDTAVVAFRLVARPVAGDEAPMGFFNTGTFVREQGLWKVVAWQATRIPEK
jgi:hypothetical protein